MRNFKTNSPLGILFALGIYTLVCMKSCTSDAATAITPEAAQPGYDDSAYARVLTEFVDAGRVDYVALRDHPGDLNSYLDQLNVLNPDRYDSWSPQGKMALWLNAYNACTLSTVIEHYPVDSIRNIPKAWSNPRWRVMGKKYSLDHMEHKILRRQFEEPRIHVALVCAAMSCPPLRAEPYRAERLEAQLEDQLHTMTRGKTWLRMDQPNKIVFLSKIFSWYGKDFQSQYQDKTRFPKLWPREAAVMQALYPHLQEEERRFVGHENFKVRYLSYDWGLNAQ